MGERNLAGPGVRAAADQRRHRGGMMGASERTPVCQRAAGEDAGDRMDHRHFEQFARRERGQDRGQPLGEHRFSRAGRAAHQKVMAAGRRHFERALGALLALDVAQVRLRPGRRPQGWLGARQNLRALEVVGELDQRARRENLEVGRRPRRFGTAGRGANKALAGGVGGDRRRQDAGDGADRPIERELPDHRETLERVGRNGADRRHDRERDRKVVVAALLRHVGGREVDGDALGGKGEPGSDQGRTHALARFGYRLVAEADDGESDHAAGDMDLNVDRPGFDALEGHRRYARHHFPPPARARPREHLQNIDESASGNFNARALERFVDGQAGGLRSMRKTGRRSPVPPRPWPERPSTDPG